MIWRRISSYCIRSGPYSVCKVTVMGKDWYEAWVGKMYLGRWEDPASAKRTCENDSNHVSTKAA